VRGARCEANPLGERQGGGYRKIKDKSKKIKVNIKRNKINATGNSFSKYNNVFRTLVEGLL
jgi:hypothetical protein